MRVFLCMAFLLFALGTTRAAEDADTLTLDGVRFRLDGIDGPEPDQPCLDSAGEVFFCGRKAYEELQKFIANRVLRCEDKGPDRRRQNRRIGQCWVENVDLQRWLVANGWTIPLEPYAKGRFKDDEVRCARPTRRAVGWLLCGPPRFPLLAKELRNAVGNGLSRGCARQALSR